MIYTQGQRPSPKVGLAGSPMNTSAVLRMRRLPRGAGWAGQRGSAMVEFPFAVLILMLMLIIVADLGRLTPWAQQVAYSADAGAQFAYRTYSYSPSSGDYRNDTTETDGLSFEQIKTEIEDHVRSAVPDLYDDGTVDIEVTEIPRCSSSDFEDDTLTVNYTNQDDDSCASGRPVVFIEVTVTDIFDPFTPYIKRIMPESLREQTFTIRRQIF
jgi:hypothetical protein